MKCLLTFILVITYFSSAVAQWIDGSEAVYREETVLIAPNEYATYKIVQDKDQEAPWAVKIGIYPQTGGSYTILADDGRIHENTLSRYLFDNDAGIEFLYSSQGGGLPETEVIDLDDESRNVVSIEYGANVVQRNDGAYLLTYGPDSEALDEKKLPGNIPEFDDFQWKQINWGTQPVVRVDTIYLTETISRVDTVRELITERIFTSDTIYINETITLAGDVDTLVINRTVTTRDTVYNFTENTEYYTRVDSIYLLGGDYLADLNSVTSVENQLEVEKLGNPYPNPASTTVSIDYVTAVPTSNMFLGVYDNQGRRVEQFPIKPSHTITFDVSNWAPGVYVYMIWSPVGVSSTKRLVVE